MTTSQSLPVLLPDIPGQRWSCHSCGDCCRSLVGHLFVEDRERIDLQGWAKELDVPPYVYVGREAVLNKRADGSCVFLDEHQRCRIHARFGEEAKPFACRIFPFSMRPVGRGWQVSFRFDCPSAATSRGEPLKSHERALADLLATHDHFSPRDEDVAELTRGVAATPEEIRALIKRYVRWIRNRDVPLDRRLVGAARLTATLRDATLENVRGPRFAELLELLFGALPVQSAESPAAPTVRQCRMLRQLAFVHAEHVTLAELRSGVAGRMRKRWQQLRRARRFHAGAGRVPPVPGIAGETSFESVERIRPAPGSAHAVDDLLVRYLLARLTGRSVFGDGYYGWTIPEGLGALWMSVAVAGWLARYIAAVHGRGVLGFRDVATALGIVDRAATRVPSLGTMAERGRLLYLNHDDGAARLLYRYALTGDPK